MKNQKAAIAILTGLAFVAIGSQLIDSNKDKLNELPDMQPNGTPDYNKFVCRYSDKQLPIRLGSCGNNVKLIQKFLNLQGAKLIVDGKFGPLTEAASITYLDSNIITQDIINRYLKK